jgi:hypothetical protein
MKRNFLVLIAISCITLQMQAQNSTQTKLNLKPAGAARCSDILSTPCSGQFFVPSADLDWRPALTHKIEELEPLEPNHEKLEKIRAEIMKRKLEQQIGSSDRIIGNPTISSVVPKMGVNYAGNKNDGWSPLDNTTAISNKGLLVTVANDTFEVYDSLGVKKYSNTLNTFINDNTIANACDPVITYDVKADRFIFYCQEITSGSGPNHMLLFFSKTNNPATGGWNYFKLTGDVLGDGSMCDYPKVGISDNDVFISSNLFNNGNYNQSFVIQIGKSAGYSGGTLNSKVWANIAGGPFTLLPLSEGQGRTSGPGIWMVATYTGGYNYIQLYHVTADITASPTMTYDSLMLTTSYAPPGTSQQKGSNTTLSNGDNRALSGFILDGMAHFVFHCADAAGVNTAINYCRADVNAKTITSKLFTVSGVDCAYPAIASYTAVGVTNDKSVMIGFGESSTNMYPSINVVNCDNAMNFSAPITVKTSASAVGTGSTERWGDYSGMCRRHNSPQACVWMAGSYGNSGSWDAYVAQIYDAAFATAVTENQLPVTNLKAYPNPVVDRFNVEFSLGADSKTEIGVYDMEGRIVKSLYSGFCHSGENQFSFNKANLSSGTYFLLIRTDASEVLHEKIVVTNY